MLLLSHRAPVFARLRSAATLSFFLFTVACRAELSNGPMIPEPWMATSSPVPAEAYVQAEAQQDRVALPSAALAVDTAASPAGELPPPKNGPPPDGASSDKKKTLTSEEQFDAILKRLDALEKSTKPIATAEKKSGDQAGTKAAGKDGGKSGEKAGSEWVDMSAEKWTVKLGGHMQLDSINWIDTDPQVPAFNYVEFRRLRLLADGVGYGVYDFRLQIDIEPEAGEGTDRPVVDIKDAYFTMNELPTPLNRWRIGNFFVPFSLEQVTNDTNNIFLERSIPTQGIFAADREVGMAFYGVNDAKDVTWTFGTFIDSLSESLKERVDNNQGQRVSGRVTFLPYYDEPSNGRYLLHTGAGILYTHDQDGIARFRARPQIHEGPFLIDSGPLAAGEYTTGNLELASVNGPFTVQSEAFLSNVNLVGNDSAWLYGAYVHCSYFLTGENRVYERYGQHGAQFGRNVPYSNFFWVPGCCGPGAWEVKARWSNLTLTDVDAGAYNDLTTGFNWYWSDRVRVMFDYIHPVTTSDAAPFGATTSDIIGMRFDYNF
jgi:phosphate-selective porin OprO/OprP